MCLINRQGRTNAENICYYRPYHISYKCGHCAECIKEKRNEWLLRSFFESRDTLQKNGYILFETLTYRESKLPHISRYYKQLLNTEHDFSCFSYEDVRKFTNLLWTTINRKLPDYDVKENIKFFLVSEYGHEDIYQDNYGRYRKGTFRPHYHVLFYVKDKKLHPGTLMKLIARCWKNGNTDFSQNGISYAMNKNVIGKGWTKDKVKNIIAVSNYVSKYITKQGDFMEKIEKRIDFVTKSLIENEQKELYKRVQQIIMQCKNGKNAKIIKIYNEKGFVTGVKLIINGKTIEPEEFTFHNQKEVDEFIKYGKHYKINEDQITLNKFRNYMKKLKKDEEIDDKGIIDYANIWRYRKEVMNHISPFHRQSRGFGLCAIEDDDIYAQICDNMQITIPDYKYVKKTYNVPMYYMRKLFYELIRIDEDKYRWQLNSLGRIQYPKILEHRSNNIADRYFERFQNLSPKCREDIINLMDGRGWKNLSDYIVYFRGRVYDPNAKFINEETGEISSIPSKDYIIECDTNRKVTDDDGIYSNGLNIVTKADLKNYTNDEEDSEEFQYMFNEFMDNLYGNEWYYCIQDIPYSMFERKNIINEKCAYEFRNFDLLIEYFNYYNKYNNEMKQETFDVREKIVQKLSEMGYKCKNF